MVGAPTKLRGSSYGYVVDGRAFACTRDELLQTFWSRRKVIELAWSPETSQLVRPEQIPFILEELKKANISEARTNLVLALCLIAIGGVLAAVMQELKYWYRSFLTIIGLFILVESILQMYRAKDYTPEDAEADSFLKRFASWDEQKKVSPYTVCLAAFIIIVGAFQGIASAIASGQESIKAAGLVKEAVWHGEAWRLLTACLMHASFMHFWMNFLALLYFARIIEERLHRAYVPLVFLVAGFCGSVFSLFLYPHTTSVGASGGLMGLLGFITMDAYLFQARYSKKYLWRLGRTIFLIAVVGTVGFAFIDNAAHLGGLCGGLLLGRIALRESDSREDALKRALAISKQGFLALIVLALIAAFAAWKMTR
jgi:membrane associated rhomboid family serine protease